MSESGSGGAIIKLLRYALKGNDIKITEKIKQLKYINKSDAYVTIAGDLIKRGKNERRIIDQLSVVKGNLLDQALDKVLNSKTDWEYDRNVKMLNEAITKGCILDNGLRSAGNIEGEFNKSHDLSEDEEEDQK